jgi:eukaryotic-like serine/threonine-protein kinase
VIFCPSILGIRRVFSLSIKTSALGLLLLLAAGASALLTMRSVLETQQVEVPSLLGRPVPEAGAMASKRGLLVRVEGKRNDPRIPPDHIVAQEPPGGTALKSHRSVRVWLSLGPRKLNLPAVEGQSLRTARLAFDQSRVEVTRVAEVNDPADEGTVLVQHPPAGEVEVIEGGIALLVSRGSSRRDYIMPDLIGRRADQVIAPLTAAGLKVADVRYRSYPGAAEGVVLRQSPAAGHRVSPRSTVSLEVSQARQ